MKELEEKGYVVRRRIRNDAGQLVDVQYTIMESPEMQNELEHNPYEEPPICESVLPPASKPTPSPALAQPTLGFPMLDNRAQISIKESIKDSSKKDILIEIEIKNSEQTVRSLIQKNVELDILCRNQKHQAGIAQEMVELMVETICSTKPLIRVNAEYLPKEMVVQRLKTINYADMGYALESS